MKTIGFNCTGEFLAFRAAEEAPTCVSCDKVINDRDDLRATQSGRPICKECYVEAMEYLHQIREENLRALAFVADPRETRASKLLREPYVNIHD